MFFFSSRYPALYHTTLIGDLHTFLSFVICVRPSSNADVTSVMSHSKMSINVQSLLPSCSLSVHASGCK